MTASMRLNISLTVLLLMLVLCVHACSPAAAVKVIKHDIRVAEFTGDMAQSTATVEGQAQSTLGWSLDGCKICVTFYDYDGKSLGVFSDSIKRLDPRQVWNFRVVLKGNDAWKVAWYDISIFISR